MEDEPIVNGGSRTVEIYGNDEDFVDFNDVNHTESSGLEQKIEAVEQEKRYLSQENELMRREIQKLVDEAKALETEKVELKRSLDASEVDKKTLQLISIRAAELETEVSRLQHDLASSMTAGEEANRELIQLTKAFEETRGIESEKNSMLEDLEKERNLLVEQIHKDEEGVKEANAHTEARVKEMEKKIESLEHRGKSVKSERIAIEQDIKTKMNEKDTEIHRLKCQLEDLDSAGVKNDLEVERLKEESKELEIEKNEVEARLKNSERQVKEMELMVDQLNKELEASESVVTELKEKKVQVRVDGSGKGVMMSCDDPEVGHTKLQWPVVLASTGAAGVAVAALAVFTYHLRYTRE